VQAISKPLNLGTSASFVVTQMELSGASLSESNLRSSNDTHKCSSSDGLSDPSVSLIVHVSADTGLNRSSEPGDQLLNTHPKDLS
jgi:hypothetical protein